MRTSRALAGLIVLLAGAGCTDGMPESTTLHPAMATTVASKVSLSSAALAVTVEATFACGPNDGVEVHAEVSSNQRVAVHGTVMWNGTLYGRSEIVTLQPDKPVVIIMERLVPAEAVGTMGRYEVRRASGPQDVLASTGLALELPSTQSCG